MPNPKLIYHLRTTQRPLPPQDLAHLYDEPTRLHDDIAHLARVGLVGVRDGGFVWEGT